MKKGLKKAFFLFLMIFLFASYKYNAGNCRETCANKLIIAELREDKGISENEDYDLLLMPFSNFIFNQ